MQKALKYIAFFSSIPLIFNVNPFIIIFFAMLAFLAKDGKLFFAKIKQTLNFKQYPKISKSKIIEFISLLIMAIFVSPDQKYSLFSGLKIASIFFFSLILFQNFRHNDELKKWFYFGFIVSCISAAVIYFIGFKIKHDGKVIMAFVPILISMIANQNIIFKNKKLSSLLIALTYISIITIAFNNHSATTKLSLLTLPFVFLISYYFPKKYLKISLQVTSILSILSIAIIVLTLDSAKIFEKFQKYEIPASFKHRICILEASAKKIIENPVTGNGLKASRLYQSEEICFKMSKEEVAKHVLHEQGIVLENPHEVTIFKRPEYHQHNFIAQVLFEFGIFGLILIILLTKTLISSMSNRDNLQTACQISLACGVFCVYIFAYSIWEVHIFCTLFFCGLMMKRFSK